MSEYSELKIDENARTFEGWASVNVVDKARELIPIQKIADNMPMYMARGGPIMDTHSGRHVGKVDEWELKWNEKAKADGIFIKGHVFDHFNLDNVIWNLIKKGHYKGLSIGGQDFGRVHECDDDKCYVKIKDLEMWEISLVESPMNKQAWLTEHNHLAKVDTDKNNERYGAYMEQGMDAAQKVGWLSEADQIRRFELLGKILPSGIAKSDITVLDAGAGAGAFNEWMNRAGYQTGGYTGIDLIPQRNGIEKKGLREETRNFDYVVASGVWNWNKMDVPTDKLGEFREDIGHLFALANKGMAFNVLTYSPYAEFTPIDATSVIGTVSNLTKSFSVDKVKDNELSICMWKEANGIIAKAHSYGQGLEIDHATTEVVDEAGIRRTPNADQVAERHRRESQNPTVDPTKDNPKDPIIYHPPTKKEDIEKGFGDNQKTIAAKNAVGSPMAESDVKVVDKIEDVGYPTTDPGYPKAHGAASEIEKEIFGHANYKELERLIDELIPNEELAGTHGGDGVAVSNKIPDEKKLEVVVHEMIEQKLMGGK